MFFVVIVAAAPDTMRAAVITQSLGSPANFSVIVPQRVPVPTPKPNEVLIKVGGSSVNPCDWVLKPGGWLVYLSGKDGGLCHRPSCTPKAGVKQYSLLTDALDHAGLEQLTQLVDAGQLRPFVQQLSLIHI